MLEMENVVQLELYLIVVSIYILHSLVFVTASKFKVDAIPVFVISAIYLNKLFCINLYNWDFEVRKLTLKPYWCVKFVYLPLQQF